MLKPLELGFLGPAKQRLWCRWGACTSSTAFRLLLAVKILGSETQLLIRYHSIASQSLADRKTVVAAWRCW